MTDLSDDSVYLPNDQVVSSVPCRVACCELPGSFASSVSSSCSSLSSDDSIDGTPTKKTVNVYCPNKHWGCQWDGSLDGISAHNVNECQFVEVTCGECHHHLPYCMLKEHHDSNCTKLPVSSLRTAPPSEDCSTMPVVVMMNDFRKRKMEDERWYSPVLVTHTNGYNIRLRLDVNGWSGGDSIAMVASLVRGENDNQLHWPFEGVITVQALNELKDCVHSKAKHFVFYGRGYECQQVEDSTQLEFGCWCDRFISHKTCQYLKDNCIFFLVSYTPLIHISVIATYFICKGGKFNVKVVYNILTVNYEAFKHLIDTTSCVKVD